MTHLLAIQLEAKFKQYDLLDIAGDFLNHYKLATAGLYPEILFETLPEAECFETLAAVKVARSNRSSFIAQDKLSDIEIKKLLSIPYSRVKEAAKHICIVLDCPEYIVGKWYQDNIELYFVSKSDVYNINETLSEFFPRSMHKHFFKEALILGQRETFRRLHYLHEATGRRTDEIVYEMYCRSGQLGYLFYPYYTDPVEAIQYLERHFDPEMIAHILKTDLDYLHAYKSKDYTCYDSFKHDENHIRALIGAYLEQDSCSFKFRSLLENLTQANCKAIWEENFWTQYCTIRNTFLKYPVCPKLNRTLCVVVTEFKKCGLKIPAEMERYIL